MVQPYTSFSILSILMVLGLGTTGLAGNTGSETMGFPDPGLTSPHVPVVPSTISKVVPFRPPSLNEIPSGPEGEVIRYGYELIVNTQKHLGEYVGNALACRNCHLAAGRIPHAGPYVGVYAAMPEYRARSGKVVTLEMRINACMQRSMNGKSLPYDGREMSALIAYMAWLSQGIPTGTDIPERGFASLNPSREPDKANGSRLFSAKCAMCHGGNGLGTPNGPPVWGPDSFNIGAGMARRGKAAAFLKKNMPLGMSGSLSDDEANDLAAFITSQPRPDFPAKIYDWPKGGKPADSPY